MCLKENQDVCKGELIRMGRKRSPRLLPFVGSFVTD